MQPLGVMTLRLRATGFYSLSSPSSSLALLFVWRFKVISVLLVLLPCQSSPHDRLTLWNQQLKSTLSSLNYIAMFYHNNRKEANILLR